MPVLTRSATKAASSGDVSALGLRANVVGKTDAVWETRSSIDMYTGRTRKETCDPEVDHCLEVQLAELALVRAYEQTDARSGSIATSQAHEMLRDAINNVDNLNVTTRRVNQAKRGPFTAAISRLNSEKLRVVPLEQLARQGRAKWLVDDGTWTNIESSVVIAYDVDECKLRNTPALRGASKVVDATLEELHGLLHALDVV